jgi:hypothetical protein
LLWRAPPGTPTGSSSTGERAEDVIYIAKDLNASTGELAIAHDLLVRVLAQEVDESTRARTVHVLGLVLVGLGKFDAAARLLTSGSKAGCHPSDTANTFNLAMALWARDQTPPVHLFQQVIDAAPDLDSEKSPNTSQCLAVACWATGDLEAARQHLEQARILSQKLVISEFSCWQYLQRPKAEFKEDLAEIERLLNGGDVHPTFFERGSG